MSNDSSENTIFDSGSGPTLEDFEIVRLLEKKDKSQLFLGTSNDSGQHVFIKWFSPKAQLVTTELERLAQNALLAQYVNHPRIVPVFEVNKQAKELMIISEWTDSEDMQTILNRQGKLRVEAAIAFFRQIVEGLSFMQEQSVIHGDLRPGHLMLVQGQVKIIGFGQTPRKWTSSGRRMTAPAAYIPPEIIHGKKLDERSDMYALACTIYQFLTGKPPFGSMPEDAVLACHAHEPFPSIRKETPHVPASLDALLRKMSSKDPNRRPSSYKELQEQLQFLAPQGATPQARAPVLIVEEGRQRGMTVEIPSDGLLLGRQIGQGFVIDDGRISREHALIRRQGFYASIQDLDSRNGTKVNGLIVEQVDLKPGDRIFVGDTVLRVEGCLHPQSKRSDTLHQMDIPSVNNLSTHAQFERVVVENSTIMHLPGQQIGNGNEPESEPDPFVKALLLVTTDSLRDITFPQCSSLSLEGLRPTFGADQVFVYHFRDGDISNISPNTDTNLSETLRMGIQFAYAEQISMATSVTVPEEDVCHLVFAPVWVNHNILGFIGFHRKTKPFVKTDLIAVEHIANLLSQKSS